MSAKVTVTLAARRGRTRDVGATAVPGAPEAPVSPTPERVPRVARVLALAHHWQALIRSGRFGIKRRSRRSWECRGRG